MILYGSTFSPFVRKCVVFAAEKGMELKVVAVGLGDPNPDFVAASPFRKMPALADGDYKLADSSAIVHYLEAKQSEPALIPGEARARGQAIWWDEWADTVLMDVGRKIFFNRVVAPIFLKREGDAAAADKAEREDLPAVLDYFERSVPAEGWMLGDFSLADIAAAGPMVNLDHAGCALDRTRYPRVADYLDRVWARPSFAALIERERSLLARLRG